MAASTKEDAGHPEPRSRRRAKVQAEARRRKRLQRYALTGAGLGLYFGYFFRPARGPTVLVPIGLALLVALVTVAFKRPPLGQVPRLAALTFLKWTLVLLILEGRHLAYNWGGRLATVGFTTVLGLLAGVWFAYDYERGRS